MHAATILFPARRPGPLALFALAGLGLQGSEVQAQPAKVMPSVAQSIVNKLYLNDAPPHMLLELMAQWTGRKITTDSTVSANPVKGNINIQVETPTSEAVVLLQDFLEKQAGIILEEQSDGSWKARLLAIPAPQGVGLVLKQVDIRTALLTTAEWPDGLKIDASAGVLKSTARLELAIYAATPSQAIALLRDALEKQAGIASNVLSDGTLVLRLKTGENDPIVAVLDFKDISADIVLRKLCEITGKKYQSPGAKAQQVIASRHITLHLENIPISEAYALMRQAIEKQAEVELIETTVTLTPRLPQTVAYNATPVAQIFDTFESWTGRKLLAPTPVRQSAGKVTLAFQDVPNQQAVVLLRDALKQQAGIMLDERPDGSFTARLLPKYEDFNDPVDTLKLKN